MNAEQLLQNFDRIAESPGSITHLRRFILDLAVRGKLVEQGLNEEKVDDEFLTEPNSEELPKNWRLLNFGKFCDIQGGNQPPKSKFIDEPSPGYIRLFQIRDLGESPVPTYIPEGTTNRFCKDGEILIGRYGASVGKIFWAQTGAYNVALAKFMYPEKAFVPQFAFLILKSDFLQATLANATRSAQAGFNKGDLSKIDFPLPPLAEQHRIVAKVDELMGLCDRLEAAQKDRESQRDRLVASSLHHLNQATEKAEFRDLAQFYFDRLPKLTTRSEHIKQLRQTILNLAVCGKLVPQDPNDEAAEELYNRLSLSINILKQQSGTRRKKEISTSNQEFFLELFPLSWIVTNFDSVNAIASGVAKGKNYRGIETLAYPYLRVANVQRGYLDLSLIKEIEIRANEYDRYRLESGDVLMTEGGDWDKLGRAAIWHEEVPNCIHQNHIYRIRSANKQELLPQWITLFANSHIGRSYFEDASKQTTNLASINMTQLRSCPLPLPPTQEQHQIVAKVDELMGLCDRLEAQIGIIETDSRRLLESLLHGASSSAA